MLRQTTQDASTLKRFPGEQICPKQVTGVNETSHKVPDEATAGAGARVAAGVDAEAAAVKYKTDRTTNGSTTYDSYGNQLDMLYADMLAGKLDTTGTWAPHIKAVKAANPKPS